MYEEQKYILFEGINNIPNINILKQYIILNEKKNELKNMNYKEFVNKGIRENMAKTMKSQGYNNDEIEHKIIEFAEENRNRKLQELEKKIKEI